MKKIISGIAIIAGTVVSVAIFGVIVAFAETPLPAITEASLWTGMMLSAILALAAVIASGELKNLKA